MAGLKYDKESVRRIFREGIMRESVIYQEILQEGEIRGEARGRQLLQQEMVLGMLNEGISIDTIARLTHLSLSEIQQIQTHQSL